MPLLMEDTGPKWGINYLKDLQSHCDVTTGKLPQLQVVIMQWIETTDGKE